VADRARDLAARVRARHVGDDGALLLALANRAILDALFALVEVKKGMAVAIADEKRSAKRVEQEEANAAEWERRALLAAEAGDDARVREALARKQEHLALAAPLREAWQAQRAAVEEQKAALRRKNEAIERAKRARNDLASQRRRNESRRRADEAAATMEELRRALDLLVSLDDLPGRSGEG
jgi:phage shock protein A